MATSINPFDPEFVPGAMPGAARLSPGGATQDRANIDYLLNPAFNTREVEQSGAERALGGGFAGSGFGQAGTMRLLDSERISRMRLGNEMLQPYLQREFQGAESAAARAQELEVQAREGAAALQRLQLSEAGQTARLSMEERARMEQLVEQGRQAMQQLTLKEAGDTARTNAQIGGNLANTVLSRALAGSGGVTPGPAQPNTQSYRWQTDYNTGQVIGGVAPPPSYYAPPAGTRSSGAISSSTIDRILRQYGLN